MAKIQYQGTGRRKSSVARVRLIPGTGKITVNKKDLEDYFGMKSLREKLRDLSKSQAAKVSSMLSQLYTAADSQVRQVL